MLKIPLNDKIGRVSFVFLIVCFVSLVIAFKIKDYKTALIVFFGYIIIKIISNYIKQYRDSRGYS
jgi:hypothetical protein